jgi:dihydrofolate reductase
MAEPRLRYFAAASIDGYIAGPGGDIDWLAPYQRPSPADADDTEGCDAFAKALGGVICGRATYEKMAGFGFWKGARSPGMVITSSPIDPGNPKIESDSDPARGLERLKAAMEDAKEGGDIWLMGGGQLASGLAPHIDSLELHVVPVVLGGGIPLFAGPSPMVAFEPTRVRQMGSGLVRHYYRRRD